MYDRSKHRYFLMCMPAQDEWFVLNREEKTISQWETNGIPKWPNAVCMESAETLPGLVGKLWAAGSEDYYIRTDWVSSQGTTKHQKYPHHYADIHALIGYIEEVCCIVEGAKNAVAGENWRVDFPSELWIRTNAWTLRRVGGFGRLMQKAVDTYIENQGLKYDADAKKPWTDGEEAKPWE